MNDENKEGSVEGSAVGKHLADTDGSCLPFVNGGMVGLTVGAVG